MTGAVESQGEIDVNTMNLRYPIGPLRVQPSLSDEERHRAVEEIAALPAELRNTVAGLTDAQLATPYRPGGWTVRQVVNHIPDSHMNGYVRFKLAVTEEEPTVKTYDEAAWAELADGREGDIEVSLRLLEALHERWVTFLRSMSPAQFQRILRHPELGTISAESYLQTYAWHGRHHLAHISGLIEREGW